MSKLTGLILASGQGSRFADLSKEHGGKPKHVFELPNGQTPVSRIAQSLANAGCDRLICTIAREEFMPWFENALRNISPKVEIVVKERPGEYTEFQQVAASINSANTIQTNGDLIFAKGVIENFVLTYGKSPTFILGREGPKINSRISVVPTRILANFTPVNVVAKARVYLEVLKAFLFARVIEVPTIFNIDTREAFECACEFFRENPEG